MNGCETAHPVAAAAPVPSRAMVRRQLAATRVASGNQTEADPKVRQPEPLLNVQPGRFRYRLRSRSARWLMRRLSLLLAVGMWAKAYVSPLFGPAREPE